MKPWTHNKQRLLAWYDDNKAPALVIAVLASGWIVAVLVWIF
jgi:hypothetical protein